MKCWCKEVVNRCYNCESRERFKKLSPTDKGLVSYFEKNFERPAVRSKINAFEKKHGSCWTDFVFTDQED